MRTLFVDQEFRHNIVKIALHPRVNNRTDARKTDVSLFSTKTNRPLSLVDASHKLTIHVCVRLLTMKISQ